jgi:hypothetical protein
MVSNPNGWLPVKKLVDIWASLSCASRKGPTHESQPSLTAIAAREVKGLACIDKSLLVRNGLKALAE